MLPIVLIAGMALNAGASSIKSHEDIRVGTVPLRVPFPTGYCIPKGAEADRFEELAAPDHRNVTLLSLADCRGHAGSNRYLIVKAPVAALDMTVERADAIKELSQAAEQPDFASEMKSMPKDVGAAKSEATGVRTNVVGEYRLRGHDDICVYFGGTMATSKLGATQNQAVGSCLTVVGKRLLELHAYKNSNDPNGYRTLLPRLKLWALRIRVLR